MIQNVKTLHVNQSPPPFVSKEKHNAAEGLNLENLPKSDPTINDHEEIKEHRVETSEKGFHGNKDTVRRRHARGTVRDETAERVFSEFESKKTELKQTVTSDKAKNIEKASYKNATESKTEDPGQDDKMPTKCQSDMMATDSYDPAFHTDEATKPCEFSVSCNGRKVSSPYCNLDFPPGAVDKPLKVTMKPCYNMKAPSSKEILITPFVRFKTDRKVEFGKEVTVSLMTGYSCDKKKKKKVPVKILWKENQSTPLRYIKKTFFGHDKLISFPTFHFCGFCASTEVPHFHNMSRFYYFAGFVREPTTTNRIFHWKLFSDCPQLYKQKLMYLKNQKDVVVDPETFEVPYGHKLQMKIANGDIVAVNENHKDHFLTQMWGKRVDETTQFELENRTNRSDVNIEVKYEIFAINDLSGPHLSIKNKSFYMHWKNVPGSPSSVFNVYGTGAIGMSINASQQGEFQHQASTSSQTSSGYESSSTGRISSQRRSANFCASTPRQDSTGVFNDDERETRPKEGDSMFSPSLNTSPQPTHSTPSRLPKRNDSLPLSEPEGGNDTSGFDEHFQSGNFSTEENSETADQLSLDSLIRNDSEENIQDFSVQGCSIVHHNTSVASLSRTEEGNPVDAVRSTSQNLAEVATAKVPILMHPTSKDAIITINIRQPESSEPQLLEDKEQIPADIKEMQQIESVGEREMSDPDSLNSESRVIVESGSSSTSSLESTKSFSEC